MTNSLIAHIDLLTKEVQRGVSTTNIDTLFEGSQEGLESIWRASAVQDREGNFHVVLNDDHVQKVDGAFRVSLHSGGAAVGHARHYGSEWFKKKAVKIWLGALHVPDGRGGHSARMINR